MVILQSARDDGGLEDTQRSGSTLLPIPSLTVCYSPAPTPSRAGIELHYLQLTLSASLPTPPTATLRALVSCLHGRNPLAGFSVASLKSKVFGAYISGYCHDITNRCYTPRGIYLPTGDR